MKITIQSTDEISFAPGPGRVWRGKNDDGVEVCVWMTIAAIGDPALPDEVRRRIQHALEARIVSDAVITIPIPELVL